MQLALGIKQPPFGAPFASQGFQRVGQAGEAGGSRHQRGRQARLVQVGNPGHSQIAQCQPAWQRQPLRQQPRIDDGRQQRASQARGEQAAVNAPPLGKRAALRQAQPYVGFSPAFFGTVDPATQAAGELPAIQRQFQSGQIAIGHHFGHHSQPAGQRLFRSVTQQRHRIDAPARAQRPGLARQHQIGQRRGTQAGHQLPGPIAPAPAPGGGGIERRFQPGQCRHQATSWRCQLSVERELVPIRFGIKVQRQRVSVRHGGIQINQRPPGVEIKPAFGAQQPFGPSDAPGHNQPAQFQLADTDIDIGQDARIGHRLQAGQAFQRGIGDDQFGRLEAVADQRPWCPVEQHPRCAGKSTILIAQFHALQRRLAPQAAADPRHVQRNAVGQAKPGQPPRRPVATGLGIKREGQGDDQRQQRKQRNQQDAPPAHQNACPIET